MMLKAVRRDSDRMSQRILSIEDNKDNMTLVTWILEDEGYEVLPAWTAEEGLQQLAGEQQIDLVLMDMQMPLMDGWEATRRLRNAGSGIPVLALTANAMPGDRQACLEAGCDDYLAKPYRLRELLLREVAWFERRNTGRSPDRFEGRGVGERHVNAFTPVSRGSKDVGRPSTP